MRRHLAQPFDTGTLHRHERVETLRDGVRDDGLPLFLEQLDKPPLLVHERVDLGRLTIEEGRDGALFWLRRVRYAKSPKLLLVDIGLSAAGTKQNKCGHRSQNGVVDVSG